MADTNEPRNRYDDEFPLWTVYSDSAAAGRPLPWGVPQIGGPAIGPLLAIFTDEDLAKRFCEDLKNHDMIPLRVPDPSTLLMIAEHLAAHGVQDAVRDLSFHPPTIQTTPIGILIDSLRKHGGNAG